MAFESYANNLDPADPSRDADVYVKDLATGAITLAASSDSGVLANGDNSDPSLSADGATVAFDTVATNLDPADPDPLDDVYVKTLPRPVSVSVGDRAVLKGGVVPRFAVLPVTLSAAATEPVTVDYATVDGTARAGDDYLPREGTLVFQPGQTRKAVLVRILGDAAPEPPESFAVLLSAASTASIGDGRGVVGIRDDD